jgi:putative MFS transporter
VRKSVRILLSPTATIPAVLVTCGRFFVTESPHWLVSHHRLPEAEAVTLRLLKRRPEYPSSVELTNPHAGRRRSAHHYGILFQKRNLRATILASVPWFLQDLGTYGTGIFYAHCAGRGDRQQDAGR